MEAIILIFGEMIFAILAPFFLLVGNLIASAFGLLISFILEWIPTGERKSRDQQGQTNRNKNRPVQKEASSPQARGPHARSSQARRPKASRLARLVAMTLTGVAVLMLAALGVVNSFYFDSSVRYVFNMVEKRSAITTTCEEIDGSLFAGRIDLGNCTIQRPSHPASSFELSVANVSLDVRVTSLLGTAHIDNAAVSGLNGWVKNDRSVPGSKESSEQVEKPRRAFVIGQLDVSDVALEVSGINPDGNPFSLPINITQIESRPLRSKMALFDILFRSNLSGSIANAPFEISTSTINNGRKTQWRAPNIPVADLGAVVGGPLSWFSKGTVDVLVVDEWQRGDSLSIDMDWRLAFSDVEVKAPSGTGAFAQIASTPLTRYVNGHDGDFPLEFALVVNENQFESKSSLAAAGLWSAVGDAVKFVLTSFSIKVDEEADVGGALKKGAKSVLDILRKPKSDEPD